MSKSIVLALILACGPAFISGCDGSDPAANTHQPDDGHDHKEGDGHDHEEGDGHDHSDDEKKAGAK